MLLKRVRNYYIHPDARIPARKVSITDYSAVLNINPVAGFVRIICCFIKKKRQSDQARKII